MTEREVERETCGVCERGGKNKRKREKEYGRAMNEERGSL